MTSGESDVTSEYASGGVEGHLGTSEPGSTWTPDSNVAQTSSPQTKAILDVESLRSQIKIVNVTYTCDVGCKLNLRNITLSGLHTEYCKKTNELEYVLMKMRNPKATAKIFKTGKLNVSGALSPELARQSGRKFARIIQNVGYEHAKFLKFKVTNITASVNMGSCLNLRMLKLRLDKRDGEAMYEPELHHTLSYKVPTTGRNKPTFVATEKNGVVWCCGFTLTADIYEAFEKLYPDIKSALKLEKKQVEVEQQKK